MIDDLPAALVSRLVEEAPDAVTIIDAGGTIRYMNPAMQSLCGCAPGEAIGQPLAGLLPDGIATRHQGHVLNFLSSTKPSTVLGKVREFAIRHRTGESIPIELKAFDLGLADGVRYFGAFIVDLRPRRKMEAHNAALLAQLEKQALTDTLTEVANRRAFDTEAAHVLARARRSRIPVTVGIADIDHFKRVNDEHGHPVGDLVLKAIAQLLCQGARASDMVARIGGEEFGLLLPDATQETAHLVAERIRKAVEEADIATGTGAPLKVTISIGLAQIGDDASFDHALALADAALYRAKENGRNRVEGG
jgi:diguanylate cyclase (GGDEF)-like protein/PAS domain S-box-containing protein